MLDKLRQNKWLFWVVPIILLFLAGSRLLMQLLTTKGNKDLNAAIEKDKYLRSLEEAKKREAEDEYQQAKEIEEKIDNIKIKDGWHKRKIKKDKK